jgi:hypothetical protein
MDTGRNNWLTVLAAEITAAHREQLADAERMTARAVAIGAKLLEAKEALQHGGWLPWLEQIGVPPRTAQNYMRLAKLPPEEYATVAHLGVRGALEAIADEVEEKEREQEAYLAKAAADIRQIMLDRAITIGTSFAEVKERLGDDGYHDFLNRELSEDCRLSQADAAIRVYQNHRAGVAPDMADLTQVFDYSGDAEVLPDVAEVEF